MEGVKTFLESSTIHGLTYISSTRKYARLFWILVVTTGFLGAILLIKESFDSWSESPVKTTIETLPIAEIKLPKVTVCPPKNTFTDLNYDLMMTENITLTNEIRDEMFRYAVEVLIEDKLSQNNWTKLHEEDRYYNWYHGYSNIQSPSYSRVKNSNYYLSSEYYYLSINVETWATSGVVTTQYYGEKYQPELVERALGYRVSVNPPDSLRENENVTLHFKLEKVSMIGLSTGSQDNFDFDMNLEDLLDADQTTVYTNFTPPGLFRTLSLERDVSSEEVNQQKLDVMPGFRFSWWYSGVPEITPDNGFKYYEHTKLFVR